MTVHSNSSCLISYLYHDSDTYNMTMMLITWLWYLLLDSDSYIMNKNKLFWEIKLVSFYISNGIMPNIKKTDLTYSGIITGISPLLFPAQELKGALFPAQELKWKVSFRISLNINSCRLSYNGNRFFNKKIRFILYF